MTIRTRLAAGYGIAMMMMILVITGIVWWQAGAALRQSLDEALRTRAVDVMLSFDNQGQVGLQTDEAQTPAGSFIAVFDLGGALLDASVDTPAAVLSSGGALRSGDLHDGGAAYAVNVTRDDETAVMLVVGSSLASVDAALADVTRALLVVGAAGVLVSIGAGWWLAGRALRPVAALTREAALIGATDLDARLATPAVRDELGVLAETLNAMIDRLAEGLRRERRFIASASHELRTPMAALQGELELADDADTSIADLRAAVRSAHADAVRLGELTSALLALAAAEADGRALVRVPVRVDELIDSAVRQAGSRAAARHTRIRRWAPSSPVMVDRVRLEQAVANLVVNAVVYGPVGGVVEVRARVDAPPSDGGTTTGSGGIHSALVIDVLDRGPGLSEVSATPDVPALRAWVGPDRGGRGARARDRGGGGPGPSRQHRRYPARGRRHTVPHRGARVGARGMSDRSQGLWTLGFCRREQNEAGPSRPLLRSRPRRRLRRGPRTRRRARRSHLSSLSAASSWPVASSLSASSPLASSPVASSVAGRASRTVAFPASTLTSMRVPVSSVTSTL